MSWTKVLGNNRTNRTEITKRKNCSENHSLHYVVINCGSHHVIWTVVDSFTTICANISRTSAATATATSRNRNKMFSNGLACSGPLNYMDFDGCCSETILPYLWSCLKTMPIHLRCQKARAGRICYDLFGWSTKFWVTLGRRPWWALRQNFGTWCMISFYLNVSVQSFSVLLALFFYKFKFRHCIC